jgi:hypothetical protein
MKRLLSIVGCSEVWYCSENCGRVLIIEDELTFKYHEHFFVPDIEQFHVAITRSK